MSSTDSVTTPTKPVHIDTRDELDALVSEHDRVLLDIYTSGCAICQSIEPVLGTVAKVSDVVVAMLNPKTDMSVADEYTIRSVPTLLLFEDGEQTGRLDDGFQGAQAIIDFVENPEQ
ncbi:thioredoxin family protein [Haloferax profundi]|uniref:Thioredoxin n=1 Tax=Haloferax profundi TaxID=1544718 RepID=A0A0W1SN36_9EURY|nr:thioredoxin family protein [Haloferax profundi]KTG27439.1 thioredoxin [Haloferax profundi]